MAVKAAINIIASVKNDKTFLRSSFASHPFKLMNITEDKQDKNLRLMMMSSSPGVLDKDRYEISIELEKEASLYLEMQSYQRLFPMKKGASQVFEVKMGQGSFFHYLPHPSVPHECSHFRSKNKIYLSDGCALVWGEVLTCGRGLHGEVFRFSHYHNCTDIFLNNELVLRENLLIKPSSTDVLALGHLEGFTHQASFIFLHPNISMQKAKEECFAWLSAQSGLEFGMTTAPINGMIIRLMGYKAEPLHNCLKYLVQLILTSIHSIDKSDTVLDNTYVE